MPKTKWALSAAAENELRRLALQGNSPAQIDALLERDGFYVGWRPSKRTIERRVREVVPEDTSERWSVLEDNVDQLQYVSYVQRWLLHRTDGRVWLTINQADLLDRIFTLAGYVPEPWAWALALAYQAAWAREEKDLRCLDSALLEKVWTALGDPNRGTLEDKRTFCARICRSMSGDTGSSQWSDLLSTIQAIPFGDMEALEADEDEIPLYERDPEAWLETTSGQEPAPEFGSGVKADPQTDEARS